MFKITKFILICIDIYFILSIFGAIWEFCIIFGMLDFGHVKFKIKVFVIIAMIFAVAFTCKFTYAEKITEDIKITEKVEIIEETEDKTKTEPEKETEIRKTDLATASEVEEIEFEEDEIEEIEEEPEEDFEVEEEDEDEEEVEVATLSEIEEIEEIEEEEKEDIAIATESDAEESNIKEVEESKTDDKSKEIKTKVVAFSNFGERNIYSIDIASAPKKTSYRANEYLDMSGLAIRISYDDNTYENVMFSTSNALEFSFEPSLNTPLNTRNAFVTINYKGHSASMPISVSSGAASILSRSGGSSTNNSGGGGRIGRVIEKENPNVLASMNDDAMNLFLLSILAANMNGNQYGFMPIMPTTPTMPTMPTMQAIPTMPYSIPNAYITMPSASNSRPEAISNYIKNNPLLVYTVNSDGSYAFSNGVTVYPNGMMIDVLGNTYYTDGTLLTSNGLTQFVNGSVKDASGVVYNIDGTINLPDNSYIDKSGVTHYTDGSVKLTDGTVYNIDGSIDFPNGTVITKSGRVIKRTKKAVETEAKEKNKAAWRYDPVSNEWYVELGDSTSTYYK